MSGDQPPAGQLQPLPLWISDPQVAERELVRLLSDARVALRACSAAVTGSASQLYAVLEAAAPPPPSTKPLALVAPAAGQLTVAPAP